MPCTTLLAGKNATFDGSTFAARNEDSGGAGFDPKQFIVVNPEDQPRQYRSVLSHVNIPLPEKPLRYTAMPNAIRDEGIWGAAGINAANVAMTATETITTNSRVLAADPLVRYIPEKDGNPEIPGGIGEEDMVTLVLPYIRSAREGVLRLGSLLAEYGTYEKNGIAFQDADEVWWLETIGGHHWIARRVPDDCYVVMPNQLGIDSFDLEDAFGEGKEHLCSADLKEFICRNHLDLSFDGRLNPRHAFGSHSDADHVYNTPRAWIIQRRLNPRTSVWDGPSADFRPDSDDIPWARVPERKLTPEDVKDVLSDHYQGTPYDPYVKHGDPSWRGYLRPIGINRNNFLSLTQIRPGLPAGCRAVEWIAFASNVFNAFVPFYTNVKETPEYLAFTPGKVTTESFYWTNRLIGAMADASFGKCIPHIERYQSSVAAEGRAVILKYDDRICAEEPEQAELFCREANEEIAAMLRQETEELLHRVLDERSREMKNAFSRADG